MALRGWRRLALSSLTDTFQPLRDAHGEALQVTAAVDTDQQHDDGAEHKLATLLRLLVDGHETMLFRVVPSASGQGGCHCSTTSQWRVFALHVARDRTACWLLPHLIAEQSVLCGELSNERWLYEAKSVAEDIAASRSIRLALLRLPLAAGPFNAVLYSSGWSECVAPILDRATRTTNTQPALSSAVAAAEAPASSASQSSDKMQRQGAGRCDDSSHGAQLREADENDCELAMPRDSSTSTGGCRVSNAGCARATRQYSREERNNRHRSTRSHWASAGQATTAATTAETQRRRSATVTSSAVDDGTTGKRNGGHRHAHRHARTDRDRGTEADTDKDGDGTEDAECDAQETDEPAEGESEAEDAANDEWNLSTSNRALDAEVALLVELSESGRRGSLRLHNKQLARRRQEDEASNKIQLIEHIAAQRFREKMAAKQHTQPPAQQRAEVSPVHDSPPPARRSGRRQVKDHETESTEQRDTVMDDGSDSQQRQEQPASDHKDTEPLDRSPYTPALEPDTAPQPPVQRSQQLE